MLLISGISLYFSADLPRIAYPFHISLKFRLNYIFSHISLHSERNCTFPHFFEIHSKSSRAALRKFAEAMRSILQQAPINYYRIEFIATFKELVSLSTKPKSYI